MEPTDSRFRAKLLAACFSAALVMASIMPSALYANPQDGSVAAGSATISNSGNQTTINQSSDKAIINWRGFSIGPQETTQFVQPSSSSISLNRVTGNNNPSQIEGALRANGQVWLINPSGIMFHKGSQVNVAGIVASTANIQDADFMAGNYHFIQSPDHNVGIVNEGNITVQDRGLVALVAPAVSNSGTITAHMGKVTLASGTEFTVDLVGDQLIQFATGSKVTQTPTDPNGRPMRDSVANHGQIYADGGQVVLSAHAAEGVVDHSINMDGVIQARSISTHNGQIVLAGNDGVTQVSGGMDVSGLRSGETGGTIHITGHKVGVLAGAHLNASGKAGGGTILIGGDYQGKGVIPKADQAELTYIDKAAVIEADATDKGNGGKIVAWSDTSNPNSTTRVYGILSAKGGLNGGDGGIIETSGSHIDTSGAIVNTTAPQGKTGNWLLDPGDITITNSAPSTPIFPTDWTNNGCTPQTLCSPGNSSFLNVNDLLGQLQTTSITVLALHSAGNVNLGEIRIDAPISSTTTPAGNSLTLSPDVAAGGVIQFHNTGSINLPGSVILNGPVLLVNDLTAAPTITSQLGSITVNGIVTGFTGGNQNFNALTFSTPGVGQNTRFLNTITGLNSLTLQNAAIVQSFGGPASIQTNNLSIGAGGLSVTGTSTLNLAAANGSQPLTTINLGGVISGASTITGTATNVSVTTPGTINQGLSLIVTNGTGNFTINGGTYTAFDNTTAGSGGSNLPLANLNLNGTINLPSFKTNAPTNITGNTVVSASSGNINFGSTIVSSGGAFNLTLTTASGTTTLGGDIGGIVDTDPQNFTVNGPVIMNNSLIITTQNQTYNGNVLLGNDVSIGAVNGNISFASTINPNTGVLTPSLTLDTGGSGNIIFSANVGNTNQLGLINLDPTGSGSITIGGTINATSLQIIQGVTNLNTTNITTTGDQNYGGVINLTSSSPTLISSSGNINLPAGASWSTTSTLTATSTLGNITIGINNPGYSVMSTGGGNLTLSAPTGNVTINGGISLLGGTPTTQGNLTLTAKNAANSITTSYQAGSNIGGAINVNNFNLVQGQWSQINNPLPGFIVTNNFQLQPNTQFTRLLSNGLTLELADIYGLQGAATLNLNNNYDIANDINASGTQNWNSGAGFIPIGAFSSNTGNYTGNFKSNDSSIRQIQNILINAPTTTSVGLFANVYTGANISNIGVTGTITGEDEVGALIGSIVAGASGVLIQNVFSDAVVTATGSGATVGGLIGFIGNTTNTTIAVAYSTGQVIGNANNSSVGGLIGTIASGTNTKIIDTFSSANVTANGNSSEGGGLIGTVNNGTTVSTSYSTGAVLVGSGNPTLGGFIGDINGSPTITANFWDTDTSGQTSGVGSGSQTGTTGGCFNGAPFCTNGGTVQLSAISTYPQPTWSISQGGVTTWNIIEGASYPFLRALAGNNPQAFSGIAYSDQGSTKVGAGVQISLVNNGVLLSTVFTDVNSFFYFQVGATEGDSVLVYINNSGTTFGNTITSVDKTDPTVNMDIYGNSVRGVDTNTLSNTALGTAITGLSDPDFLYSVSGGSNLALNTNVNFQMNVPYIIDGNITGSNTALTFANNVSVTAAAPTVSTGSGGSISFLGDITGSGSNNLTLNSAGVTTLGSLNANNIISGLGSLTTNSAGSTTINASSITTNGAQTYNDPLTITSNSLTLNASAITLPSSITNNGTQNLALNNISGGGITINGAIVMGSNSTLTLGGLTSLTPPATLQATTINLGGIITGSLANSSANLVNVLQPFGNIPGGSLNQGIILASPTGGTVVAFAGSYLNSVDSPGININANIALQAPDGGSPVTVSSISATSPFSLQGKWVSGSGGFTFSNPVSLTGTFPTTLNSTNSIVLNGATGTGGLTTTTTGATQLAGTFAISGPIAFNGAITLANDTTLSGSSITTSSTISGNHNLTVSGATSLGGSVTTGPGFQIYNSAINITSITPMTFNGSSVFFGGSVTDNNNSLTVNAPITLGNTSISLTGTSIFLGSSVTGSGSGTNLTLNGPTTLNGNVSTAGNQTYNNAVTLGNNTFVTLTGNALIFASPISGTGANLTFNGTTILNGGSVSTPGGTQRYNGAVTANADTTFTAGNLLLGNNFTAGNHTLLFSGNTILVGNSNIATGSGNISFDNNINGGFALTLNSQGTTTLTGAVGNQTPLASLTIPGFANINGGVVATSGNQTYLNTITLGQGTTLSAGPGTITLNTVNGNQLFNVASANILNLNNAINIDVSKLSGAAMTVNLNNPVVTIAKAQQFVANFGNLNVTASYYPENVVFNRPLNLANNGPTSTMSLTSNAPLGIGGTWSTGGNMSLNNTVSLKSATNLSANGGNMVFGNTINGNQNLVLAASGMIDLAGPVGNSTPLASFTSNTPVSATTSNLVVNAGRIFMRSLQGDNATLNGTEGIFANVILNGLTLNGDQGGTINGIIGGFSDFRASIVAHLASSALGDFIVNGCVLPGGCVANTVSNTPDQMTNRPIDQLNPPACTLNSALQGGNSNCGGLILIKEENVVAL